MRVRCTDLDRRISSWRIGVFHLGLEAMPDNDYEIEIDSVDAA